MATTNVVRLYSTQATFTKPMKETLRPYRLWDSVNKQWVQYRNYSTDRAALDGALLLVRWEKVGRTLEVIDVKSHRLLAIYKRGLHSIEFSR